MSILSVFLPAKIGFPFFGLLAQLVQSAALTEQRSLVRAQCSPHTFSSSLNAEIISFKNVGRSKSYTAELFSDKKSDHSILLSLYHGKTKTFYGSFGM
jgi:hypothetical protein